MRKVALGNVFLLVQSKADVSAARVFLQIRRVGGMLNSIRCLLHMRPLLHFLDPVKFNSKDTFVERYKNLSSFNETELANLHKELRPHILRRVIKDVQKSLPPKIKRILRIEMSPLHKHPLFSFLNHICLELSPPKALTERCFKYHKGCSKYTEGLGEAYDGDIAFARSLEAFGGGHNDPISVVFGGRECNGSNGLDLLQLGDLE